MKKRVLSMLMTLALCLTLLPTPAWAAEDAPEGGVIVQQEQQEEISPAVSEQAGTNEAENGSEGDPQNTGTPDAGGAEDSKADAPESGEDENAGNNADAAVSAVQTMIDALPTVSELDGMTAGELDAAYNDIQAAYDAYEALNAEQQAQITGADFEALLGWFNSQTAPLADAKSGVHTHCVCGKDSSTTVNGHTHNTGTTWTATNALPSTAGSYYLTQSVSENWTVPTDGEVTLCLNGQTINGKITVGDGATLTLTDCSGNGKVQGEVTVNGGKFELYSGTITGGVQVGMKGGSYNTGSAFTMYGGAITGNEDYGGVFLVGTTNHIDPPSFTMHGGTISDNTAGASDGGGGGVYVGEKCSFTMDGGTITGNTATAGNGGGIYIHFNAGNVSISNATITGNKASATGNTSYGHGGGIYSQRGVTVKNVTITGNNSTYEGGGIYGKGAITLTDATVTDNSQYDVYYDGRESNTPELTISGSVKAGYYANYDWKLPILVSGALSEDSVIRVGVREGINPGAIAEPASGVTLSAENFKADAADSVTSLGNDGKVYLVPCTHEMDDTGYTCKKCHTQFDARVGDSAYYQTLTKAFDAARGSTVTLLRDVTLTGNCSSDTYSATLDLNGKTVSTENKYIHVGGGNKSNTLTVKDSSKGGGTQALNVKFSVGSNGTLAVDDSYTGEISRVELQAGGALERFGGKIGELVLSNAAYGSTSTGYGLKLWKGNPNACTIGKITDNTKSKSLTVNDLLGTDYAKCELYGEKDDAWSIVPKTEKISELTGYTAYKVQFTECVHQCADDSNPVCSVCHKDLYTKITAKAADGTTKTAYFTEDSALENGYVEAIQTLNGWSNEGCTEPTLTLLRDMPYGTSITLTGTLTLEGGTHTASNVTVAENANVTFASGSYSGATINGTATVETGVTFTAASVTVNGTLNAKGGIFNGPVKFNGSSTANISGGSYGEITSGNDYVKPYALLAKGYAYKKEDNTWVSNANIGLSKVTVEKAPFAVEKIYPNRDTNYTGNSAFATDGNITLTAVIAPETQGVTYYYWWELFDESDNDWTTHFGDVNTATHTGEKSKTLTISGLPTDKSYQYHIFVQCSNGYQCYSEPFTVTQHQHSWTYTASGATITAKCTAEGCYLTDGNGGSVTIAAPTELTYSGEGKPATVTASSDWQGPAASGITISYIKTGKYGPEKLENDALPTKAGTYTASITLGEGNKAATASVTYTIGKATPKAEDFTFTAPTSLTYDGNVKSATVSPADDVIVKYYDKDGKEATPKNAGEYTVKIDVAESTNYAAANGLTADGWKFSITKAAAPAAETGSLTIVNGHEKTYTVTLPALPTLETPKEYGTLTYEIGEIKLNDGYYTGGAKVENGELTLPIQKNDVETTGSVGTVTVVIKSTNYEDITLTVNVSAANKIEPTPDGEITATSITYGDTLSKSNISGKMKDPTTDDAVKGTFAWKDDTIKPAANDSYVAEWTFTPDAPEYATVTGKATVKVAPKSIEGATITLKKREFTYNAAEQSPTITGVTLKGWSDTITYHIVNGDKATNANDSITLTIKGSGNYTGTATAEWKIIPAKLTVSVPSEVKKEYDGTTNATVTPTFNGLRGKDNLTAADYSVTAAFDNAKVGYKKTVIGKVTLNQTETAKNYVLTNDGNFSTDDGTIAKAAAPTVQPVELTIYNGVQADYYVDLPSLPDLGKGKSYGTVGYRKTHTINLSEGYKAQSDLRADPENLNTLRLLLHMTQTGSLTGEIGTVTIPVTTSNYQDINLTVNVSAVNQIKPKPVGTITATPITYGNELSMSTITGTMQDPATGDAVNGTFTWVTPDEKLKASNHNAEWTFTPDKSYGGKYTTNTGTATVTVNPKAVTVSGITANDKVYDGNTNAVLDYSAVTLGGVLENDTLTVTAKGMFEKADVGEQKVKISELTLGGGSAANYVLAENGNQTETTANITAREVTVTITPNGGTYGSVTAATAKLSGAVDGENIPVTLTYTGNGYNSTAVPTNAGSYTVTASIADSNYVPTGETTANFVIEPKSIKGATVKLGKGLTANGAEQTQTVAKVLLGDKEIPADSYTVSGNTATAHGIYTLTVTGKGNYKDFVKWTYVIAPAKAEDAPGEDITIGSGKVKVDVQSEGTVPPATLLTDKAELLAMLVNSGDITADELVQIANGANVDIVLTVKEANDPGAVKTAMAQAAKDYTIGQYLDISLFKYMTVNGSQQAGVPLHTTKDALTISVVVPDALINTNSAVNRTYCIVRNHEGTITVLDAAFDAAGKTLTFKTDRFSIYAIAYKDTAVPSSGSNPGSNNSSNDSETKKNEVAAPTPAPTPASTSKPSTITAMPQTGDTSNPTLYVVLLVASLLGLAVVFVCKKRNDK